ncbi:DNA-processing protein DprA [Eubacteriaceae bacterium ES3]|nr:DNA-processing protein DprA [Eubacteriaceae bacterium ES3]
MKEIEYWLWLTQLKGISNLQKNKILNYYKNPKSAFLADEKEFIKAAGFRNKKQLENFKKTTSLSAVNTDLERMQKEGIEYICLEDERFPSRLKEIYNPPISLFLIGDLDLLNKEPAIAVVGSRNASTSALRYAKAFSKSIASMGIPVISGLAEGVDGSAHWGALEEPGKTVAVLGTGVDLCYPDFNEKLYLKIAEKGLLISEFNIGEKPLAYHFPLRNRLISGLTNGVLLVEAGLKSGSMITVNHALDQGKNIYVIPGEISNPRWSGGNALLKEGAKLVTEPQDVLEDFIIKPEIESAKKVIINIEPEYREMAELISRGYDTVDELTKASGLEVFQVNQHLTMMELEEIIGIRHGKITLM